MIGPRSFSVSHTVRYRSLVWRFGDSGFRFVRSMVRVIPVCTYTTMFHWFHSMYHTYIFHVPFVVRHLPKGLNLSK